MKMSGRSKVVITHRVHEPVKQLLSRHCEVIANDDVESWPANRLRELAADAQGLLVFMPDKVDDALLAHCRKLKVVAAALKGYDNIDVAACSQHGIWVTVVPDLLSQPTAELALALTLGLVRNVAPGDHLIRSGKFQGWRPVLYGSGLAGKNVGVLGMGRLGQAFARLLAGFNCRVTYHDPLPISPVQEAYLGISRASMDQVLAQSDVVVILVPLVASTLHMMNDAVLSKMKEGAYLVNVGRGSVVDEAAVARALERGHLAGYAADVFEMEDWARPDHPASVHPDLLVQADKTLFTPHLGSAVAKVRLDIEMSAAQSILEAIRGERPRDAVNEIEPKPHAADLRG